MANSNRILILLAFCYLQSCSLDFDKYQEFTKPQKPTVRKDMMIEADMGEMDAIIEEPIKDIFIDLDTDQDQVKDAEDNCPNLPNPQQEDLDNDRIGDFCDDDDDGDMINDMQDNCPIIANPTQEDTDLDLKGDACDDDQDGDTLLNMDELARNLNPLKPDSDADGVKDAQDLCLGLADIGLDIDQDQKDNRCDTDDDGDSILDWLDNCPMVSNADQLTSNPTDQFGSACLNDYDGDQIANAMDLCPFYPNANMGDCPSTVAYWGFAQEIDDLSLKNMQYQDALANNQSHDFLWMATKGGIYLYAQDQWVNFSRNHNLSANHQAKVYQDAYQRIWSISDQGELTLIKALSSDLSDANTGATKWFAQPITFDTDLKISAIAVKAVNEILLATQSGIVSVKDAVQTKLMDVFQNQAVLDIWYDANEQNTWVISSNTVAYYDATQNLNQLNYDMAQVGDLISLNPIASQNEIWVFGTLGSMRIDAQKAVTPYQGKIYTAVSSRTNGLYFGNDQGSTWQDQQQRFYQPSYRSYEAPNISALASTSDGETYVGTNQGLSRVNAVWNPVDFTTSSCVYDSVQLDYLEDLIVATDIGAYFVSKDGAITDVVELKNAQGQNQKIYQITKQVLTPPNADAIYRVWFGTERGLSVFEYSATQPNGQWLHFANPNPNYTLPTGAIRRIEVTNKRIWIGSMEGVNNVNGLAYARLYDAQNQIIPLAQLSFSLQPLVENYYVNSDIRHISHDGSNVYISTASGLSVYSEDTDLFIDKLDQSDNLPSESITFAYAKDQLLVVGTALGFFVKNGDQHRQIKRGTAIPIETETNHSITGVLTDDAFWAYMRPAAVAAGQESGTGSVIYFPIDRLINASIPSNNPNDYIATRYTSQDIDLPFSKNLDLSSDVSGVKFKWDPITQQLHVNVCGSDPAVGNLSILDGTKTNTMPSIKQGLIGSSVQSSLIQVHDKIWFSTDDQQGKTDLTALSLLENQKLQSTILPLPNGNQTKGIKQCVSYVSNMEPAARCIFNDNQLGTYKVNPPNNNPNLQWTLEGTNNLLDLKIRDMVIEYNQNNPNNIYLIFASDLGVVQFKNNQRSITNRVKSNNVLPSDNIYSLEIINKNLYIGTDLGLAKVKIFNQEIDSLSWKSYADYSKAKVYDIKAQTNEMETAWVGTADSLIKIQGDEVDVISFEDGLIAAPVYQVEIVEQDNVVTVYTLTPSGLSAYDPSAKTWKHYPKQWGFAEISDDQVPHLYQQKISPTDIRLWIQGTDGVVQFDPVP